MSSPKYYSAEVYLTNDSANPASGIAAAAFFEALSSMIENASAGTKTLYFVVSVAGEAASVIEYNAVFDGNGNIEVGGVLFDATATGAITLALTTALGLTGGAALFAVSVGVGVVYTSLKDIAFEWYEEINGSVDVDIQLKDSNDNVIGGALYEDGLPLGANELDAAVDLVENAVSQGITSSISDTMIIDIEYGNGSSGNSYYIIGTAFTSDLANILGISSISGNIVDQIVANHASPTGSMARATGTDWLVTEPDAMISVSVTDRDGSTLTRNFAIENILTGGNEIYGSFDDGDLIIGTQGNDIVLNGRGGNDSIYGRYGNDEIFGDAGDDYLLGGQDSDFISGGIGNDIIWGDTENLNANVFGNDTLYGDDGNDHIYGGAGEDEIHGGTGSDNLYGGDGDDQFGATNNDSNNYIDGGDNDTYSSTQLSEGLNTTAILNTLDVRGDTVDYSNLSASSGYGVRVNLSGSNTTVTLEGGAQATISANTANIMSGASTIASTDTLIDIENVWGTEGADVIVGNGDSNVFHANGGSDHFEGRGGTDYFYVDLPSGNHSVVLDGGAGKDFFYIAGSPSDYSQSGTGSSRMYTRLSGGSVALRNYDPNEDVVIFENSQLIEATSTSSHFMVMPNIDFRPEAPVDNINSSQDANGVNVEFILSNGMTIIMTSAFPIGTMTVIYVDGVPTVVIDENGEVILYPADAGDIVGYQPDGTQTDILTGNNDIFVGGRPVVNLPDDDAITNYVTASAVWSQTDVYSLKDEIESTGSPLVLDIDMDGQIELTSLANTQTYWDIDEDGFAEASGWVSADDGLLAIDLNGNGVIDGHNELFGNLTTDGFTELAALDSNSDGVIDALDTQFGDLLVWQDVNQNGISGTSELHSLADFNITSIDLNASTPSNLYIEGHHISHVSSFTVDDGVNPATTHEIVDAWFEYDNINTLYNDALVIDPQTFYLPNLRGYGNIATLQIASSIDNDINDPYSLMSLVKDFAQQDFSNVFANENIFSDVENILFRWAGVDGVDPALRGLVDAREVAFLEKITGDVILGNISGIDFGGLRGDVAERGFDIVLHSFVARLTGQLVADELFEGTVSYNASTDVFDGITGLSQTALNALLAQSNDGALVSDKTYFWINVANTIDQLIGIDNLSASDLAALETTLSSSDPELSVQTLLDRIQLDIDLHVPATVVDGDDLDGTGGDDVYVGGFGDDRYLAGYGIDTISGGIGNDILYGGDGNDILKGGLGNDGLAGDGGDDTFLYSQGHGNDIVYDTGGTDTILFDVGITANDLTLNRTADGLLITIDPTVGAGSILIDDQFSGYGTMEFLEFSDGSTINLDATDFTYEGNDQDETIYGIVSGQGGSGIDTIYGRDGNDTIYGNGVNSASYTESNFLYGGDGDDSIYGDRGDDELYGEDGNDGIIGDQGNDLINGGLGDDTLYGGVGSDTYIFNYGDGNDTINEYNGDYSVDRIEFGASITQGMITVDRNLNGDLMLYVDGGLGGSINIVDQINVHATKSIEEFSFADGTVLTSFGEYILEGTESGEYLYGASIGGSGIDIIYGHGGNDRLYGYKSGYYGSQANYLYAGEGNDYLYGEDGMDSLYGESGTDILYGYAGDDLLDGGDGNDSLYGAAGNDIYYMGLGNDYVSDIGGGDDTFIYTGGMDTIYQRDGGNDTLILDIDTTINDINFVQSGYHYNLIIDSGVNEIQLQWFFYNSYYPTETIQFQDGFSTSLLDFPSWINGTSSADTLNGTTAAETLIGKDGDDVIDGDAGDDDIHGGAGNDTLYGGDGADDLWGGVGSDTFVFESASAFNDVDTIGDFSVFANDVIDISDLLTGYDPVNDAISDFVQISYDGVNTSLFVDADGGADNFIQVANVLNVSLSSAETLETYGFLVTT